MIIVISSIYQERKKKT